MTNKVLGILMLGSSLMTTAQVSVAAKANLLFPTDAPTWRNISDVATEAYNSKGKSNVGFNAGLSLKVNLVNGLFLMPELYYTTFSKEFTDPVTNTTLQAKSNRADLPVLIGMDLISDNFGVFAGPVASYNLSTENQYNDFAENAKNEFSVGYQLGAQIRVNKLIFTGRYEGAFTQDQRDFIHQNTQQTIRYDNRPSVFLAGVGYQF